MPDEAEFKAPLPPAKPALVESSSSESEPDEATTFPMPNSAQRAGGSRNIPADQLLHPNRPVLMPAQRRAKVILEPGHSALDWARVKQTQDLTVPHFNNGYPWWIN